jgi:putative restriction endonuclease
MPLGPFIAVTDLAWFEYLASRGPDRCVDEVNFWSPKATRPMRAMRNGEPVFFRLKSPINAVAGYGFFAAFTTLDLRMAWQTFGDKNGDPDVERFLARIGGYRDVDLLAPQAASGELGCTILRDAVFWPRERWIPWGELEGWAPNIVKGKTERDAARASRLLAEIQFDQMRPPEDFAEEFEPVEADERTVRIAETKPRVGQGAFRARILDAYGRKCAVTGEKTEPVLQAAHVQPYLGPSSNHLQNGILMAQEVHTLFDEGLISITPDYEIRVSKSIRERWSNGRRFYECDGKSLLLPEDPALRPSRAALE